MHVHWHNNDLEGRQGIWPAYTTLVVILFYCCSNNARYTNTITTHSQSFMFTGFRQYTNFHGITVLCAELENMAHFNASGNFHFTLTTRAWVAGNNIANIHYGRVRSVALPVDARQPMTIFIGATGEIGQVSGTAINQQWELCLYYANVRRFYTRCFFSLSQYFQRSRDLFEFFRFHCIQFMVRA